jgi:hypothetical protein
MPVQLAQHEPGRLPLHLVPQRLLFLQDAPGRRADGAVIEVGAVGIEHPMFEHRAAESGHPGTVPAAPAPIPAIVELVRYPSTAWEERS